MYARVCVCVYQEEIPVFFEIKARGGNIELEKLVSIVFMSYIYIYMYVSSVIQSLEVLYGKIEYIYK